MSVVFGSDSEYGELKAVLLSPPHPAVEDKVPRARKLHAAGVEYVGLREEHKVLSGTYRSLGVRVVRLDPRRVEERDRNCLYNLMFTRDHFFMTPAGAVVGRMHMEVRKREAGYAAACLKACSIRIRLTVSRGSFEGADALWAGPRTVIVATGNRTSREGYRQLKDELAKDGVECLSFSACRHSIHLLGSLQFLDRGLCLARTKSLDPVLIAWLRHRGMRLVEAAENDEVRLRHSMNLVVIAPRSVLIPAGCPYIAKLLSQAGVRTAESVPSRQLANAGGGIACASGILCRSLVLPRGS